MIERVDRGSESQSIDTTRHKTPDAARAAEPRFLYQPLRLLIIVAIRITEAAQLLPYDELKRSLRISNYPAGRGRVEAVQVRVRHRMRADFEGLGQLLYLFGRQALGSRKLTGLRRNIEGCLDTMAFEQRCQPDVKLVPIIPASGNDDRLH